MDQLEIYPTSPQQLQTSQSDHSTDDSDDKTIEKIIFRMIQKDQSLVMIIPSSDYSDKLESNANGLNNNNNSSSNDKCGSSSLIKLHPHFNFNI